jgi:hypothetical protein
MIVNVENIREKQQGHARIRGFLERHELLNMNAYSSKREA